MAVSKTRKRLKAPKRLNVILFGVGLFLDGVVTTMALYSSAPPFDPVLYGFISAIAKAANGAIYCVNRALKGLNDDDSDTDESTS